MKFRDPKTGEMFESLEKKVVEDFCMKINCGECPMNIPEGHKSKYCCDGFMTYKPIEAARLMGYEVVEDDAVEGMCCDCAHGGPCCSPDENTNCADRKEDGTCWVPYTKEEANMGKPRICEVLGVEVGEVFTADTPYGQFKRCVVDEEGQILNTGINVLCYIINHPDRIIRKPRWTEQEVEDAKAIKRVLKATGIRRNRYDNIYATGELIVDTLLDSEAFPSLQPDTAVTIDEIIGGAQ